MTLRDAIKRAAEMLFDQSDLRVDATRDAELLLLHATKWSRTVIFTDGDRTLAESDLQAFFQAIKRRTLGEPIQYITGEQEFYGLALKVTPAVLIPRPETELLVESVLGKLPRNKKLRIVDVGTGSGAIAIVLAKHLPLAEVTALDVSEKALHVANENAARHGLNAQIRFVKSDLLGALADEPPFDAIVSNPPYIPNSERATLHRQVREFEPATALFAGIDGLEMYRKLIPQVGAMLKPGALLAMEFGYGQQAAIRGLLEAWDDISFLNDLQEIPRVATARRR